MPHTALAALLLAFTIQTTPPASGPGADAPSVTPPAASDPAEAAPAELRRKSFNVDETGLALQGYDPISYLDKAGPKEGKKEHALVHRGITYRFATAENKAKFEAEPAKYEPPYGGWCAWAMKDGEKVEIDPKKYRQQLVGLPVVQARRLIRQIMLGDITQR
jgi:YHS domain-containing protein